jgi:hypothetical protein
MISFNIDYLNRGKNNTKNGSVRDYMRCSEHVAERIPTSTTTTTTTSTSFNDDVATADGVSIMFLEDERDHVSTITMRRSNPIAVPRNNTFANYWRARYARNVDGGRRRRDYTLDELESLIRKAQRKEDLKKNRDMAMQQQQLDHTTITTTTATTSSTSYSVEMDTSMIEESTSEYDTDSDYDEYDFDETSDMLFQMDL